MDGVLSKESLGVADRSSGEGVGGGLELHVVQEDDSPEIETAGPSRPAGRSEYFDHERGTEPKRDVDELARPGGGTFSTSSNGGDPPVALFLVSFPTYVM